ncbi:heme-dependent catalase [Hypomontagnella monticulosa]|nr:heme-dependent catalase [Hypomontagnella monticulosa]
MAPSATGTTTNGTTNGVANKSNGASQTAPQPPITPKPQFLTTMNGAPVQFPAASQRIGANLRATLLLQDINLLEIIQHLTHERIPERLVHARGTSAFGWFEVTDAIDDVTSAAFLNQVGKRTPLFVRFSTVAGERGSAETVRDTRGFAFKMRTEEGILDWLFLSTPVFPIRDGAKFPSFTHATKRNPVSGLPDHTMFWDYFTNNQEAIHFLMFLFSDRATPVSFQNADCFSINTYRFTKPDGTFKYVKIHVKTSQGVKNFTFPEAVKTAGEDPDYHTRSLHEDLEAGNQPAWDVYAQIIDPEVAEHYQINIFDATKTLPFEDFPLRKFGKIYLDKNVRDFFSESEQSAFSPTNIVPGWALTPDPILQTRSLAYADTQRHRLGTNFIQFPINKPESSFTPLNRDGNAAINNLDGYPNYYPSSFQSYIQAPQYAQPDEELWNGTVVDFESTLDDKADFTQATIFWEKTLAGEPGQQDNFVSNVAVHLASVTVASVRQAVYDMFTKVNADLGMRIQKATEEEVAKKTAPKPPVKAMGAMNLGAKKAAFGKGHNAGIFAHKRQSAQA